VANVIFYEAPPQFCTFATPAQTRFSWQKSRLFAQGRFRKSLACKSFRKRRCAKRQKFCQVGASKLVKTLINGHSLFANPGVPGLISRLPSFLDD